MIWLDFPGRFQWPKESQLIHQATTAVKVTRLTHATSEIRRETIDHRRIPNVEIFFFFSSISFSLSLSLSLLFSILKFPFGFFLFPFFFLDFTGRRKWRKGEKGSCRPRLPSSVTFHPLQFAVVSTNKCRGGRNWGNSTPTIPFPSAGNRFNCGQINQQLATVDPLMRRYLTIRPITFHLIPYENKLMIDVSRNVIIIFDAFLMMMIFIYLFIYFIFSNIFMGAAGSDGYRISFRFLFRFSFLFVGLFVFYSFSLSFPLYFVSSLEKFTTTQQKKISRCC